MVLLWKIANDDSHVWPVVVSRYNEWGYFGSLPKKRPFSFFSFYNEVKQPAARCNFSKFICRTTMSLFWTFSVVCVRVWVRKWQNWRPLGPVKPSKVLTANYLQQWRGMKWIWTIVQHQVFEGDGWAGTFCKSHWLLCCHCLVIHQVFWQLDVSPCRPMFYCPCWRSWHWFL